MKYVFLIGAAKCGTTALAEMLAQHPGICVSTPKETDFFTNKNYSEDHSQYHSLFKNKSASEYCVDASVSYSAGWGGSSTNIAERISLFSPNAKILYVVRDPVQRTWSAYWHARRRGYEKKEFSESIRNLNIDHIQASMFHKRLSEYKQYFADIDQIKVLEQNQLLKNTQATVNDVYDWMKIEHYPVHATKANETYQLSPFGEKLHKLIPGKTMSSLGKTARMILPYPIQRLIKSSYSNPIPKLDSAQIETLLPLFSDDLDALHQEYGVDARTGKWWDS